MGLTLHKSVDFEYDGNAALCRTPNDEKEAGWLEKLVIMT